MIKERYQNVPLGGPIPKSDDRNWVFEILKKIRSIAYNENMIITNDDEKDNLERKNLVKEYQKYFRYKPFNFSTIIDDMLEYNDSFYIGRLACMEIFWRLDELDRNETNLKKIKEELKFDCFLRFDAWPILNHNIQNINSFEQLETFLKMYIPQGIVLEKIKLTSLDEN